MINKRLKFYFSEAKKHIEKIENAREVLSSAMPLSFNEFEKLDEQKQDKLDIMAFRFSKLQDLLGDKIFRLILEYSGFNATKPFIELLSELEKENLLNVDKWIELREARNKISHEYPDNEDKMMDSINFIYKNLSYMIELNYKLEEYFYAIENKRNK